MLYYLEIHSWENDADENQFRRIFDTNKEHLEYIQKFIMNFKSSSLGGMGNEVISDEELISFTEDYISDNCAPVDIMHNFTPLNIRTLMQRALGVSENYSYEFVRAVESTEIEEISQKDLNAYLDFKKKIQK